MIIPCIDLMGGKVVQLIQGRKKALEGESPEVMLKKFAAFPEIQVIDLDAAMGRGSNNDIVLKLACSAIVRVGGGVRSVERARELVEAGASKVIIGTSAFDANGVRHDFLREVSRAIGKDRLLSALDSKRGHIVVKGWQEATSWRAEEVIGQLEPYSGGFLCTYVDKEGMMQGTDLDWYRRLRLATRLELTAAGGITTIEEIKALDELSIHAALGMAIYTGRLNLDELTDLQNKGSRGCTGA
ncbi:MAG: 1-(5-phosphoribosyl)-5-[(5-phosphoribosylamino)methylideneamino] imidazole-4-carboxamide isomerase [Bryobacterales bacterium]|nr:1-(5-phosphoribosyl)-5-[(5-phosphoribosylamino)methylideneamino] imidazole-4-carboxamide isomerase [Bryobacterales bacterium]